MKSIVVLGGLLLVHSSGNAQHDLKIWYDKPADATAVDSKNGWENDSAWLLAIPVGNGYLGAMVFGDVNQERIQLNEKTLWSGSPDDNNNPDAAGHLPQIRKLLFAGKYKEANDLAQKTQVCKGVGSGRGNGATAPYGSYQTLGDLRIDFGGRLSFSNYRRELDLLRGVVTVSYTQDGIQYKREIFASYPDRVLVIRFTASQKGSISFTAGLDRPEHFQTTAANEQLTMTGVLPDGKGGDGMKYTARLRPISKGGEVHYENNLVRIAHADEVLILLTAATNYQQHYPDFRGKDPDLASVAQLRSAGTLTFEQLLARHVQDFSALMGKTQLTMKHENADAIPTDQLLQQPDNLHLYEIYFQFGRYLLLSSSRNGTLPANLQGIWSNKIQTPWNGDYHTNINLQMNYWPADVANLSTCFDPFTELVASLVEPGKKTAAIQYHAKGWCQETITNLWGYTSPGEGVSWGMYVAAGGWLCQQLYDHYLFTMDRDYLKKIFPVLLESARFYLDWLVKDPASGEWVSGPSTSPENSFYAPDGSAVSMSMGPSHDQEIISGLFSDLLDAASALGNRDPLLKRIESVLPRMAKPKIGTDGRLMEWRSEFKEVEPAHRHVSHLYLLYPAAQLNPFRDPRLADAARKSLDARTDVGTGWSLAWKVNFWARLLDGERAFKLLKNLLHPITGMHVNMADAGGTYPNLFCGHPPFQIDGNFGGTAGIAEMLVQSHLQEIQLLPALPQAWAEGNVFGLRARGGFEIAMHWKDHQLTRANILSYHDGICRVRTDNAVQVNGVRVGSKKTDHGFITEFETKAGTAYLLTVDSH